MVPLIHSVQNGHAVETGSGSAAVRGLRKGKIGSDC